MGFIMTNKEQIDYKQLRSGQLESKCYFLVRIKHTSPHNLTDFFVNAAKVNASPCLRVVGIILYSPNPTLFID